MRTVAVTTKETTIHILVQAKEACLAGGVLRHNRDSILGTPAMVTSLEQEVEGMEVEGDPVEGCSRTVEVLGVMVMVLVEKVIDRSRATERCVDTLGRP